MIRKLTLSIGLAALGALGLGVAPAPFAVSAAWADETPDVAPFTLGDPNAPIELEEFASFTCSHCAHFHDEVFKRLKADYIDTGKVHFTYREVYWDPYAVWAGLLARCGGEMRFFGIASMLYEKQRDWIDPKDPQKTSENLRRIGKSAGLSDDAMNQCLTDGALAKALSENSDRTVAAAGVEGTPSLVIDGKLYKNMSYKDLKEILDKKLAG